MFTNILIVMSHSLLTSVTFPVLYNLFFFLELMIAFVFYLVSYTPVINSFLHFLRNRNYAGKIHMYQAVSPIHPPLRVISPGDHYFPTPVALKATAQLLASNGSSPSSRKVSFPSPGLDPLFPGLHGFHWFGLFHILASLLVASRGRLHGKVKVKHFVWLSQSSFCLLISVMVWLSVEV